MRSEYLPFDAIYILLHLYADVQFILIEKGFPFFVSSCIYFLNQFTFLFAIIQYYKSLFSVLFSGRTALFSFMKLYAQVIGFYFPNVFSYCKRRRDSIHITYTTLSIKSFICIILLHIP